MALTKIKLDSFVSGNLPDANIPNDITIDTASAVPASGLTGNTLASGVTASSLTSVGTLAGLAISDNTTISGDNKSLDVRSADYSNVLIGSAGSSGAGLDRGLIVLRENGSNKTLLYGDGTAEFAGTITNTPNTSGAYGMFVNQQNSAGWGLRIAAGSDSGDNLINAQNGSGTEKFVVKSDGRVTLASRLTLSSDGSDNGLFMGGGWQIFDNASESFGTAGDLIFYHGAKRVIMADDGGFKIKQGAAGAIAKAFSLENAGDSNLAAAIFEENGSPTSGELRLYSGGSEKVYLRANSSSSSAFWFKGGQMQDITANNTGIQFRFNADTGFINRIDNNFDGASAASSYMRFKVASSSGNQQTALTLNGAGHATVETRLYVTASESGVFGTELYNGSATGHGTKIRGGSTSSHYSLYVSNNDQTAMNFQVLGDGTTSCRGGFTSTGGVVDGDSGLKTQQAQFKRLHSNSFSNGNIHDLVQVNQKPFIVKVEDSAGGFTTMGFPIGGAGIAYNWSMFDVDSNTWSSNASTITSTGTNGNTYNFSFLTGSGIIRIQRTNGSLSFTVRVYQFYE